MMRSFSFSETRPNRALIACSMRRSSRRYPYRHEHAPQVGSVLASAFVGAHRRSNGRLARIATIDRFDRDRASNAASVCSTARCHSTASDPRSAFVILYGATKNTSHAHRPAWFPLLSLTFAL
jgi:hypothetical protein